MLLQLCPQAATAQHDQLHSPTSVNAEWQVGLSVLWQQLHSIYLLALKVAAQAKHRVPMVAFPSTGALQTMSSLLVTDQAAVSCCVSVTCGDLRQGRCTVTPHSRGCCAWLTWHGACRRLDVPVADIITPGYTMSVPREGFPKPGGGKVYYSIEGPASNCCWLPCLSCY